MHGEIYCQNIVAAKLARKCEIQLVYAIGIAEPVSIYVDTFGTSPYSEDMIIDLIRNIFDLRSSNIISHLGLNRPIYKKTATYGHFGRNEEDFT